MEQIDKTDPTEVSLNPKLTSKLLEEIYYSIKNKRVELKTT